jgi:hypothetical protein
VQAPRFHHMGLNVDDFEVVHRRARDQPAAGGIAAA